MAIMRKDMNKGGIDVSPRIEQIIQFGTFFLPILLVLYGILVQTNILNGDHFLGIVPFVTLGVLWILIGIIHFLMPPKTRLSHAIYNIIFHVFTSFYILFVSGFSTPFIVIWIALLLTAFIYFGMNGMYLSATGLIVVATIDIIRNTPDERYVLNTIISLIATFAVGSIVLSISRVHDHDKEELIVSKAKESLQRDRTLTLINNLADAILGVDKNGIIQEFNAAALNLLDTNESLEGRPIDTVLKCVDENNKRIKFSTQLSKTKSVVNREDLSAHISEETIRLSVIYSPIRGIDSNENDIGKDGYIVILRDITKQKSLEEERDEFISVVSHELRTPITIAEGSLSNARLMMSRTDMPKEATDKSVKIAHDQVLFLAKMVNDLSTLSRAERGVADEVERIDIKSLIHDLYNEYLKDAQTKGLTFDLALEHNLGEVTASKLYLKELLQNFVTNAIKYTKEGGVTIHAEHDEGRVRLSVSDTGIGISKSDQAHIYEKFYRAEDYRTRETNGTGLGLYVAMKLSRKLGTKIELKSRLNHGSTFSFSLPSSGK